MGSYLAAIRMAECPISPSQGAALLNGQIVPGGNRATAIVAMRQVVKTISKFALTDSHLNGNTRAIISSPSRYRRKPPFRIKKSELPHRTHPRILPP
jgi:hypothetical protein